MYDRFIRGGGYLMAISDKVRKILWGKSGSRCAFCKHELVIDATSKDDQSVVGDECHIVSRQANGPRYRRDFPTEKLDSYDNLILLCRIHHKMVDDQHETFTEDILKQLKENHERWVADRLNNENQTEEKPLRIRRVQGNIPEVLPRITSGKEIINIIDNAMGYEFDHDEPENEEEVELISGFFQYIQDLGYLLDDFESGERVRHGFEISNLIRELSDHNYYVFGTREIRIVEGGKGAPSNFPIAIIYLKQKDNKTILKFDLAELEK
jgi:hypothetical protein